MTISDFSIPEQLTSCRVLANNNLNAIYASPIPGSGIGATLTNAGSPAALVIDTIALDLGDRVVVYNQTNAAQNGIYEVTVIGDSVTRWVLQRSDDFQVVSQMRPGLYFPISAGSDFGGELVVVVEPVPAVVGIDPISLQKVSVAGSGTAANKDATDNTLPYVASARGPFVVNDIVTAADILGTIKDSGVPITSIGGTHTQDVYVSPEGSDITGTGTVVNPYLTINHAISTITDAAITKLYSIKIGSGNYSEGTLTLKPFVSLSGNGFCFVEIVAIALDPSFLTAFSVNIIENIEFSPVSSLFFDFSTSTAGNVLSLSGCSFNTSGFNVNIEGNNQTLFFIDNFVDIGGPNQWNIHNVNESLITEMNLAGSLEFLNSSNTAAMNVIVKNTFCEGNVTVTTTGTQTNRLDLFASYVQSQLQVSGAHAILQIDSTTFTSDPVLTSGGTYTIVSLAEGVNANFVPVNYTPAGTHNDVKGHLQGIDNALGVDSGLFLRIANNLSDVANKTTSFNNVSPLTTKGDLITDDGTNNVRIGVGTNGAVFNADSTQTTGNGWVTQLNDAALVRSVAYQARQFYTAANNLSLDYNVGTLVNTTGQVVENWQSQILNDATAVLSHNWNARHLYANDGVTIKVDYSNPSFTNFDSANGLEFQIAQGAGTVVNYTSVNGAPTGNTPIWQTLGADANIGITFMTKGSGSYDFTSGTGTVFEAINVGTAANNIVLSNAVSGTPPTIAVGGTDANVSLELITQGIGVIFTDNPVNANGGFTANDLTTVASINANTRNLIDNATVASVDWQNRILFDVPGNTSINWGSREIFDETGQQAIIYFAGSRFLKDGTSVTSVDWGARKLLFTDGTTIVANWATQVLNDSSGPGLLSIDWNNRLLSDGSNTSINYNTRSLLDMLGNNSLLWQSRSLIDSSGNESINYQNRLLRDSTTANSINYQARNLIASDGSTIKVDYSNPNVTNFSSTSGIEFAITQGTSPVVNYVSLNGSPTANDPIIRTQGSDTNIGLTFENKGAKGFSFTSTAGAVFQGLHTGAGAVNYLQLSNAATGNAPALIAVGTDTNINLQLTAKGTGYVQSNNPIAGLVGFRASEATNGKQGTATLAAGTVTVSNTSITANSRIFLTAQDNNTLGSLRVSARTAGTNFTITSSLNTDNGLVAFEIFEPA